MNMKFSFERMFHLDPDSNSANEAEVLRKAKVRSLVIKIPRD